eukprot:tig00020684_g12889.t1
MPACAASCSSAPLLYFKCARAGPALPLPASVHVGDGRDPPAIVQDAEGRVWKRVLPDEGRSARGFVVFETTFRKQLKVLCPRELEGQDVEIAVASAPASRAGSRPLLRFALDSPYRTERQQGLVVDAVRARVGSGGLIDVPFGFAFCSTDRWAPVPAAAGAGPEELLLHGPDAGFEMRFSRADGAPVFGAARAVVVVRTPPKKSGARRPGPAAVPASSEEDEPAAPPAEARPREAGGRAGRAHRSQSGSGGAGMSRRRRRSRRGRGRERAAVPHRPSQWVDDSTVAAMEAMFAAAEAASRMAALRRGSLFKEAAALFRRIESAGVAGVGWSGGGELGAALRAAAGEGDPAELVRRLEALFVPDLPFGPAAPSAPPALPVRCPSRPAAQGGGAAEAARRHVFGSDEERAASEARFREVRPWRGGGGGGVRGAAAARELAVVLATEPVLDSRLVLTDPGQKELRAALRAVRAATRSMALERSVVLALFAAAAAGVAAAAHGPISEFRAACERGWRLTVLVHDNVFGVIQDLEIVPSSLSLRLALLTLEAARPREHEDPRLLAEACYWAGLRSVRMGTIARCDEEALEHFFAGLAVIRAHGLYPSREEAWLVRAIGQLYLRHGRLDEAREYLDKVYWFENTPEDTVFEFYARASMIHYKAKAGLPIGDAENAACEGVLHRLPRDADHESLQIRICTFIAFIQLKQGSFLRALGTYRQVVTKFGYPHSPALDFITFFIVNFSSVAPAAMARGLRVACALHRFLDWDARTPLSAHMLNLLGRLHLCCGDFPAARAAFEEALAGYQRFPDVYTADHPRICFLHACIDACSDARSGSGSSTNSDREVDPEISP